MSELIWMEHGVTGHRNQLPDLPYWRGQGWSPCDGPHPEDDTLHDPAPEPAPAAEAQTVKPANSAAKPAAKPEEK